MPAIVLDGKTCTGPGYEVPTLAELLGLLDRELDAVGRIVTDVRLDGVDEPAFRSVDVLEVPLARLETVEVRSDDPQGLLRRLLADALAALAPLAASAQSLAADFRNGAGDDARYDLGVLGEGLATLVELIGALALAGAAQKPPGVVPPAAMGMMNALWTGYESAVNAVGRRDWVEAATALEDKVGGVLVASEPALAALVPRQIPSAP